MTTGDHDHHRRSAAHAGRGRLALVLAITAGALLVEAIGGVLTGSLALLADAGHMLTDTVAIGSVLLAVVIGGRPADRARTFGSARWEVIAAAVNFHATNSSVVERDPADAGAHLLKTKERYTGSSCG
jgi:cobalt-zinc-cadmium efflux system protein